METLIQFTLTEKFKFSLAFNKDSKDKFNIFLKENQNRPTYAVFIKEHLDIFNVDNFVGYSYFPFKYLVLDFEDDYHFEVKKGATIHTIKLLFSAISIKYTLLKETSTSFVIKNTDGHELNIPFADLETNNFNFQTFSV